jgi:hypothetical protein
MAALGPSVAAVGLRSIEGGGGASQVRAQTAVLRAEGVRREEDLESLEGRERAA